MKDSLSMMTRGQKKAWNSLGEQRRRRDEDLAERGLEPIVLEDILIVIAQEIYPGWTPEGDAEAWESVKGARKRFEEKFFDLFWDLLAGFPFEEGALWAYWILLQADKPKPGCTGKCGDCLVHREKRK